MTHDNIRANEAGALIEADTEVEVSHMSCEGVLPAGCFVCAVLGLGCFSLSDRRFDVSHPVMRVLM